MPLSKSRFVTGTRCHRYLWWKVHEPDAPELEPDKVLQDLFDQGRQVGELARSKFPGGVLIDLPHDAVAQRVAATRQALADGAPAIFEATFVHADTYVAIDVLEKLPDGHRLIEVKQSTEQKDEHIPDVAVQAYVAAANDVPVRAAHVLHLNKECRHPDLSNLFAATDVTAAIAEYCASVPTEIAAQLEMLAGPIPERTIGSHCKQPHDCPFMARCWSADPHHISQLYNVGGKKVAGYLRRGITTINDLPATEKLQFAQRRQIKALRENRLIVEPTLAEALEPFSGRLGFLDFETIQRAVPVWPGMKPWEQTPAQFSYHECQPDGSYKHEAFLAEGPLDCRPALVEKMVRATAHAERVVMYSTFERDRIRGLQTAVPALRAELEALEAKLLDLRPVVRNCVYHPGFGGQFGLKHILSPLVPELSYNDLVIVDGRVASVEIARLLFVADKIPRHEKDRVRQELLDYCERDTWATVRLVEELRKLAGLPPVLRTT
jgi:hypothetical protein